MSKSHFVLVHGAYHRAWHWKFLKEELQNAGYKVSDIDLPSNGDDAPIDNAMTADVEVIKALLEKTAFESDHIVPVFHSYSGIPGSDAVAELSDAAKKKVLHLVYLGSFVLPAGSSLIPPGGTASAWASELPDGKFKYVPDPIPYFYHDVEPELAQEAASHLVKGSISAFHQTMKHTGWRMYPKTYISCKDDRAALPARTKAMFDRMSEEDRNAWQFEEIEGSHSPFLSRPGELARLLRKIVGESEGRL